MKKLNNEEGEQLMIMLKFLKKDNWLLDKSRLDIVNDIISYHQKIYNYSDPYESLQFEDQLCMMTQDLCNYFKKEIVEHEQKKCTRCRKLRYVIDFNIWCRGCEKKYKK